jgi:hypothetical protein
MSGELAAAEILPLEVEPDIPFSLEVEGEIDTAVSPEDWAPAPEFASYDVWCPPSQDWTAIWRPGPDGPWFCRNCGATDHQPQDHEGDGA